MLNANSSIVIRKIRQSSLAHSSFVTRHSKNSSLLYFAPGGQCSFKNFVKRVFKCREVPSPS